MFPEVVRLLIIEDNLGDATLVKEALEEVEGKPFRISHAETLQSGLDRLMLRDIDVILLDVSLPDSHGLDGLSAIRILAPDVPVVLLTGWDSESLSLRAVQNGAQDYLVKGSVQGQGLARTLQQAIVRHRMHMESASTAPRQEQAGVVGLIGVKGGVGSTTIACHLGLELKRQTEGRVLLMDLDLAGNAIGFLMNVTETYGITDAADDILKLDPDRWRKLVASGTGGLDVLQSGGPAFREEKQPIAERVRFVIRFARSLYRWIIVDLGRLNPFSVRLAEEAGRLYLVSTSDILSLNEARATVGALVQSGFGQNRLSMIVNPITSPPYLSREELEKLLGVPVEPMLPECNRDFADSFNRGERLGQSRKFQRRLAQLAADIAGTPKDEPAKKSLLPSFFKAFRDATAGN